MRIAYVSYEHPLGIAGGGIGTYLGQIARLMAGQGNDVEVFSGHLSETKTIHIDNYQLHLIQSPNTASFRKDVVEKFKERHQWKSFEIMESAEFGADALYVKRTFPNVPLVVKLHTPTYLVDKLNNDITFVKKFRFLVGGLLRAEISRPYWNYNKENDPEYQIFKLADTVCSPSNSLKNIITESWSAKKIIVLPNVFIPQAIRTPATKKTGSTFTVTFIGKLEKRKGIISLMHAIPLILSKNRNVKFVFVGSPSNSPMGSLRMDDYLKLKLRDFEANIQFTGFLENSKVNDVLGQSDCCVFPSLWENFPTVCLEAMAAGVPVIGTNNGGMTDIIEHNKTGLLILPNSPRQISEAILRLEGDRLLCEQLGENAEEYISANYNATVMAKLITDFYLDTIRKQ